MRRKYRHFLNRIYSTLLGCGAGCVRPKYLSLLDSLRLNGLVKLNHRVDQELLTEIKHKTLQSLANLSALNSIIFHSKGMTRDHINSITVDPSSVATDLNGLREETNFVSLKSPLVHVPEILKLLDNPECIELVGGYLGKRFALTGVNVRLSFANVLGPAETNFWHVDPNAGRLLKLFVYLTDVKDDADGPTQYVLGTHREKFTNWDASYRIKDDILGSVYVGEQIISLTGDAGQLRLADTTGIHRGLKVSRQDRVMITLNFCSHREFGAPKVQNELRYSSDDPVAIRFVKTYPSIARYLIKA